MLKTLFPYLQKMYMLVINKSLCDYYLHNTTNLKIDKFFKLHNHLNTDNMRS